MKAIPKADARSHAHDAAMTPATSAPIPGSTPVTPAAPSPEHPLNVTTELLARARAGDGPAVEQLVQKYLPLLRRWARGRLPSYARDLADTQDVVQDAMVSTLNRIGTFEQRHPGALQAYLRQAVVNRIRDEIRRVTRRPLATELDDQAADAAPSPLDQAIGREGFAKYEAALQTLRPADREAIVARVELQHSYEEVALMLGKPNANAARVAVARAVTKLVTEMTRAAQ